MGSDQGNQHSVFPPGTTFHDWLRMCLDVYRDERGRRRPTDWLGRQVGRSGQTVRYWLAGERGEPEPAVVHAIAEALGAPSPVPVWAARMVGITTTEGLRAVQDAYRHALALEAEQVNKAAETA